MLYEYMCNSEGLSILCTEARALIRKLKSYKIEHIDRSYNKLCDTLAKNYILSNI